MSDSPWIRVSKHQPCEICGKDSWCGFTTGPKPAACCMRTPSATHARNGGWIHRLDSSIPRPAAQPPKPTPSSGAIDWQTMLAEWGRQSNADRLAKHASDLGVSARSLDRLGCVWAEPHRAWAFPMRQADGTVCGIRLRAELGKKWAVTGSHQGLFLPDGGQLPNPADQVMVCEGPTDTAAMLDLGFVAVGRPSCSGCVEQLVYLVRKRHVVILSDWDEPKARPDGSLFYPGQEGAERLATALAPYCPSIRVITPPQGHKDAREWKRAGGTHEEVLAAIDAAPARKVNIVVEPAKG